MNPTTQPSQPPPLTPEEWAAVQKQRLESAKPRFSLLNLIPDKLTETGAQMTYLGAAGLAATGVVALAGSEIGIEGFGDHLSEAITVFTAMLFGGGGYRQLNKRQVAREEDAMLNEDFGALPDDDEFGASRD